MVREKNVVIISEDLDYDGQELDLKFDKRYDGICL